MPVYIQDDQVLLIGLDVAVDAACCCDTCPTVTVICDSISANKTKCGFDGENCDDYAGFCNPMDENRYTVATSSKFPPEGCEGATLWNLSGLISGSKRFLTRTLSFSCYPACTPGDNNGITQSYDPDTCVFSEIGSFPTCGGFQETVTNSTEYTTEQLIENTVAALPAYDGVYNDPCFALRDLSDDELSYSIQSFKPKFTISDSRDTSLNICYNEHFIPDDGGPPIDTPRMVTITPGFTEVVGAEVVYPDENGVITITDVDCCKTGACCIEGECSIITQHECEDSGGDYFGDDTTCFGIDCTFGACCYSDIGCIFQTFLECFQSGGAFQGVGTTCSPNPCPGICCDCVSPMPGCSETLEDNCPGSWTQNTNEGCVHCMCSCCLPGTPFPCCEQVTVGQCISDGGTVVSLCGTCEDDTCTCVG